LAYPLFHPARREDLPALLGVEEFGQSFPGEGEYLELKQGVSVSRIQEAAVAFSNHDGGVYIVGVAPDGHIVGVGQPGERAKDIHQALRDARNPGRYDVHELGVGDHTVLVLAVARRHEGFAQTSGGAVLTRSGASNTALLGDDLSRFLSRRSFQRFELTPITTTLDAADPALVVRLASAFGWPDDGELSNRLEEEGFVTGDGGRQVLTVAGGLLLLSDPRAIGERPYIDIRRYAADDPDPDRTWQITGPADAQVEQATNAIVEELGSVNAIVGVQRVEMPKIPPRVIREAIANAVAHRSYEHAGTAVRVEIHPSHLTITSPGSLPEPVTLDNLRFQQSARNDRLLGALRRLGLAEDLGKGIDRMEDDMADELLRRPEFADDGSYFSVTLHLSGAVTTRERAWIRSLVQEGRLDGRAAMVVVAVAREGTVTNGAVRRLLDVDSVQARSILQSLVSLNLLVRRGERGGAEYRIAPNLGVPSRIRHTDEELDQLALDLARERPVTNSSLREHTGLDRQEALRVLRRLVERGELVQRGQKRGARYELSGPPSA
jgi:ATP-dependent DNA helicase RecG